MSHRPVRLHAFIEGTVQGVGFRMFVADTAAFLDLTGWVRNTFAGEVEVVAEGSQEELDRFYTILCEGPRGSRVLGVRTEWQPATNEFDYFDILRTE